MSEFFSATDFQGTLAWSEIKISDLGLLAYTVVNS
jgi:hypothetical protein